MISRVVSRCFDPVCLLPKPHLVETAVSLCERIHHTLTARIYFARGEVPSRLETFGRLRRCGCLAVLVPPIGGGVKQLLDTSPDTSARHVFVSFAYSAAAAAALSAPDETDTTRDPRTQMCCCRSPPHASLQGKRARVDAVGAIPGQLPEKTRDGQDWAEWAKEWREDPQGKADRLVAQWDKESKVNGNSQVRLSGE